MRSRDRNRGRTRRSSAAAAALAALVSVLAGGCGVLSPEEQLLADYYQAARLHDTAALTRIASADFTPRTMGIVRDFEVVSVEPLRTDDGREARMVTVAAQVRRPDGETGPQTLQITIRLADGRWRVTDVRRPRT